MTSLKDQILGNAAGGIQESFDPELLRSFDVADQKVPKHLVDPSRVKLHKDMLRLSGDGIFYTLQGEGVTMGIPVVFLRLHVCNLRCVWCDAYYTWNPKSEEFWTESYELSPSEVADTVRDRWHAGCINLRAGPKTLVITGGEPLLQKTMIDALMVDLAGWHFEIETNGTIMPSDWQLARCQFNCSPKLANSECSKASRINSPVLQILNRYNTQFKFVVMTEEDIREIITDFLPYISHDKVVIMPQGVTSEEVNRNAQNIVDYVKRYGFRLMTRLQVDLWGAKRGV